MQARPPQSAECMFRYVSVCFVCVCVCVCVSERMCVLKRGGGKSPFELKIIGTPQFTRDMPSLEL